MADHFDDVEQRLIGLGLKPDSTLIYEKNMVVGGTSEVEQLNGKYFIISEEKLKKFLATVDASFEETIAPATVSDHDLIALLGRETASKAMKTALEMGDALLPNGSKLCRVIDDDKNFIVYGYGPNEPD